MIIKVMLVLLLGQLCTAAKKYGNSANEVLKSKDYGTLTNCDKSLSDFQIKWSPKNLKYGENVTASGYIIPNRDASMASICVNVTVDGIEGPLINQCVDGDCDMIHKFFPRFCPFKKGVKVEVNHYTQTFMPDYQITPGKYHVLAHLYDKATNKPLLCVSGDITIDDSDDYDDYDDYHY